MKEFYRFINRAYIVDGKSQHSGEALLLAMLMHTHAPDRQSDAMTDVQRIMHDINLDKPKPKGKTPYKGTKRKQA